MYVPQQGKILAFRLFSRGALLSSLVSGLLPEKFSWTKLSTVPENVPSEDRRDGRNSVRRAILAPPELPWMRAERGQLPLLPPQGKCTSLVHNTWLIMICCRVFSFLEKQWISKLYHMWLLELSNKLWSISSRQECAPRQKLSLEFMTL